MRNTRVIAAAAAVLLSGAALLAGCTVPRAHTAAAKPAATDCLPAPYQETLFLRGRFSEGVAREDYALQWRCNAYLINVDLSGEQTFRIQDARLGGGVLFGGPPGAATPLPPDTAFALTGGLRADAGELKYVFAGPATVRLDFGGAAGKPSVTIGAKSFVDVDEKPVDDAAALSLHYDSRDSAHKRPFGAIVAGEEIEVALSAKSGIARATLVIETRRLEGWQEVLEYRELARVPLTRVANGADERWEGKYKFDRIGVYGYYFEIESGGRRYLYTNNADPVPFTREVGSNGRGAVIHAPTDAARIRRYRQTVYRADYRVPDWARDAVYYYIFPDRFRNGDRGNDPKPGVDKFHAGTVEFHKNWLDKPWLPRSGDGSDGEYSNDFFGGDLAGIIEKLDYIRALGANALYINPIFTASSNHKYDTADYHEIDPHFGKTAEFEKLNREAARRGMRVILDTSLNHTGRDSLYFNRYGNFPDGGAFDHGRINPGSKYAKWYMFHADETDPDRQYQGWAGVADLPELDKSQRSLREFFYGKDGVMQLWLGHGLSGWRMDVTPWIPDDFWREWRTAVKQAKPDAVAVAETFFDASKYFLGDEFDSTMNYIFRSSVVAYANGAKAGDIYRNIELMRENYPPQAFYALMNLIDSHDSARALHDFGWRDEAKDSAETVALAKRRLRLAAFFQMTSPGAPAIYYGDEVGVTGGDDPFDRGTYPWPDLGGKPDEALLAEYKKLTRLRHAEPVLRRGSLDAPIHIDDRVIVVARRDGAQWALVAMNNDAAPRTLKVTLPAAIATARFSDALTGAKLAAAGGALELTVPAMYGSVLLAHGGAPAK
jgi:cyclomaltodextrinase